MQQEQKAATVAETLRVIAAWLESHPDIEPHWIEFPVGTTDKTVAVKSFCHPSVYAATLTIQGLGLEPNITTTGGGDELFKVSAEIAPGVRLDLLGPA
jgi:hypothetical protein